MRTRTTIDLERMLIESSESGAGVPAVLDAALAAMGSLDDTRSWGAVIAERENGHEALQLSTHARPDRVERVLKWIRREPVRHLVVEWANETLSPDGGAWTKVCAAVGGSLPGERLTVVLCWWAEEVADRAGEDLIRAARFAAAVIGPRCSLHVPVEVPLDAGSDRLFEGSAVGMVLADLSGRIRRVNAKARALLGREAGELLGKSWAELVHDDDKVRLHMACADLAMGLQQTPRIEARFVRPGAEPLWGAATVSMLSDRDQRPWNMVAVLEDLTHKRGASVHVEQARARFRLIFEQAPVGMVDASPVGTIRSANRQFCEMLGYTELELVGRSWKSITDPEDITANQVRRDRAVTEGESPYSLEKRYVTKDGRSVPALVHVSIVRDSRGEVESLFAIIEDLTEKRQLAAQLVQTAKMESLGRLAGGIAHDFGNLLAAITGSAELVRAEIEAGNRPHALEKLAEVRSASESASRLTRQLLSFARRESLSPKAVSVVAVCERVGVMLRRLSPLGITVRTDLGEAESAWRARGDTGQIEQIMLNLTLNARDAIEAPGVVTIAVSNERVGSRKKGASAAARGITAGDWVRISVSDTGSGISTEDLPRIFEPFYTTKRTGFGLGLANVYSMVKQWGGDVQATSRLGRGSRFDVWLPRAGPELALAEDSGPARVARGELTHVDESRAVGAMSATQSRSESQRPLAVVVDDQPEIRDLVRVIFERAGYRVKLAVDGREGISLIRSHAGELANGGVVLTDQRLPHASGLEVAAACRAASPRTGVVLSSGDTTAVEVEAKALGVRLLPKPFGPAELLAAVRSVDEARATTGFAPHMIACD